MLNLEKYKTAIFDCDGVILNSNEVKNNAFRGALEGEDPHLIEEFIASHKRNGGISRYVKFESFYRNVKKEKNFQESVQKSLVRYAQLVREGLMTCNEIPGIREILEKMRQLNIPCYVVSGGDQQEVRDVFSQRGLDGYFKDIFGSPTPKNDHLKNLDNLSRPAIYFGDAQSDMEVAEHYGLDFVFISGQTDWEHGSPMCKERGAYYSKGLFTNNRFPCFFNAEIFGDGRKSSAIFI